MTAHRLRTHLMPQLLEGAGQVGVLQLGVGEPCGNHGLFVRIKRVHGCRHRTVRALLRCRRLERGRQPVGFTQRQPPFGLAAPPAGGEVRHNVAGNGQPLAPRTATNPHLNHLLIVGHSVKLERPDTLPAFMPAHRCGWRNINGRGEGTEPDHSTSDGEPAPI